jgi:hypothetical protein
VQYLGGGVSAYQRLKRWLCDYTVASTDEVLARYNLQLIAT